MAKVFKYRGKSLDEIKKLGLDEFSKLLTSRERRNIARGLSDRQKKLLADVKSNPKKFHKTHERDMVIVPQLLDIKLGIHNGKEFVPIMIKPEMLGHRLGEFVMTRGRIRHSSPGAGATRGSKHIPLK